MSRNDFCAVLLGAALLGPTMLIADDKEHETKRYYDREHKQFHEWNKQEDRSYRQFLQENHREYHDWKKASQKEQDEYWHWRHEHADADRR